MKNIKLTAVIVSLIMLVLALTSCQTPPEDLALPDEDCVMVYTISENEYIRILCSSNSQFHFYGEWVKGDKTEAVYLEHYLKPSTFAGGDGGLICDIEIFDPAEKGHSHSSACSHTYSFEKGAMNSAYLINPQTEEKIPITLSMDKNLDFYFSWVSQIYIHFFNTDNTIYKEETQNFWYDFALQQGEWTVNGTAIPIRMEFTGVTPTNVTLRVYDISGEQEKEILLAYGALADENTFVSQDLSGTMFYEGTVTEIKIVKQGNEQNSN